MSFSERENLLFFMHRVLHILGNMCCASKCCMYIKVCVVYKREIIRKNHKHVHLYVYMRFFCMRLSMYTKLNSSSLP